MVALVVGRVFINVHALSTSCVELFFHRLAKENGAKGISFFDGNALTKEQLKAIKEASK